MSRRTEQRPLQPVTRFAYTRKEAAASLGVSVDHFERHVQPHIKVMIVGQLVLVPPTELERFVKNNARPLFPNQHAA